MYRGVALLEKSEPACVGTYGAYLRSWMAGLSLGKGLVAMAQRLAAKAWKEDRLGGRLPKPLIAAAPIIRDEKLLV